MSRLIPVDSTLSLIHRGAARPAAGLGASGVGASGVGQGTGPLSGRHAVALSLLGFASARAGQGESWQLPASSAAGGDPALAGLAADFRAHYASAKEKDGMSDANARHIAGYETIMANRSSFPPGPFYIHTDLGDGASITTLVPGIGGQAPAEPPSQPRFQLTSVPPMETSPGPTVDMASVAAAYAEWAA